MIAAFRGCRIGKKKKNYSDRLESELAVAANEEGEEPKQAEHERDHRALIVLGS